MKPSLRALGISCGIAAFAFSLGASEKSILPPFSDKNWSHPATAAVSGEELDLQADVEKKRATSAISAQLEANTIYDVVFEVTGKGNLSRAKDHFGFNSSLNFSYEERAVPGQKQAFRSFIFNDTAGKKPFWFAYRSGSEGTGMKISGLSVKKFDPAATKSITLDEPLAWDISAWAKDYTTLSTEAAEGHIDGGDAIVVTVSGTPPKGANVSLRSSMIPLAPSSEYEISAWVKSDAPGVAVLGVDSGIPGKYKHYYKSDKVPLETQWRKRSIRLRTPSQEEYPVFELGRTRGIIAFPVEKGATKLYVKNWTLTKIK